MLQILDFILSERLDHFGILDDMEHSLRLLLEFLDVSRSLFSLLSKV